MNKDDFDLRKTTFVDRDKAYEAIQKVEAAYEDALGSRNHLLTTRIKELETQVAWAYMCESLLSELEIVELWCREQHKADGDVIRSLQTRLEMLEGRLGIASYTTCG
jgi:hypothetical protein